MIVRALGLLCVHGYQTVWQLACPGLVRGFDGIESDHKTKEQLTTPANM